MRRVLEPLSLNAEFAALAAINDGEWIVDEPTEKKRGRKVGFRMSKRGEVGAAVAPPMSGTERVRRHRDRKRAEKVKRIAILDMETDPFDADMVDRRIEPFLAVLYTDDHDPVVIWEQDNDRFIDRVIVSIESLPGAYTIYAHNGGRFDFLFLVSRLRGAVSFKGRGIMSARIGAHELRDSFHIIPERLANWQKDKFDYAKLKRASRETFKKEIIDYCVNDCRYLLDIVQKFIEGFGLKLTIGQAAMSELRKVYDVGKFYEGDDNYVRQWFFGGRVECLRGRGEFVGDYKLYDVNSLYPHVMAAFRHPIGAFNCYTLRYGAPGPDTVFIDLTCRNQNALIGKNAAGETTAGIAQGRFRTTIWEYEIALKYDLISDIKINLCVDCSQRSDFANFVNPLYSNRLRTKSELDRMKREGLEGSAAFMDMKKDDIFYKLLLNNAYGKFAINPRNFKEHWLTDPDELPPDDWFKSINRIENENERSPYLVPAFESDRYWIWEKPNPGFRFNNVGVAASITGAARAVLLEALQLAAEPIYCDTDSIICRGLSGVSLSKTALGAWDLENEFSRVVINGKKLYACEPLKPVKLTAEQIAQGADPRYIVKSKGASQITMPEMECMLRGMRLGTVNRAPTLDRFGGQNYLHRVIRATAPIYGEI